LRRSRSARARAQGRIGGRVSVAREGRGVELAEVVQGDP
jgi:hypothetical protein